MSLVRHCYNCFYTVGIKICMYALCLYIYADVACHTLYWCFPSDITKFLVVVGSNKVKSLHDI